MEPRRLLQLDTHFIQRRLRKHTDDMRGMCCECAVPDSVKEVTKKQGEKKKQKGSFKTWKKVFFFFLKLQARSRLRLHDRSNHGTRRCEAPRLPFLSFFLSFLALVPNLRPCFFPSDSGLYAGRTGIQMQAENPGGHPGVRASSGGQRPGRQEHQGWSVERGLHHPRSLSSFWWSPDQQKQAETHESLK